VKCSRNDGVEYQLGDGVECHQNDGTIFLGILRGCWSSLLYWPYSCQS